MKTIVNIRGTNGSGKTTVVRAIMNRWPTTVVETVETTRSVRPRVYKTETPAGPVFIFGSYEAECGGCDTIKHCANDLPILIRKYAEKGNVLFEGLLISGFYSTIGESLAEQERSGKTVIFAFMDTPVEVCISRTERRRALRGETKPLNSKNLIEKHKAIETVKRRITSLGHTVIDVNHEHAINEVVNLFGITYAIKLRK